MRGKSFRKKVSSAKVTPSYPRKGRQRGKTGSSRSRIEVPLSAETAVWVLLSGAAAPQQATVRDGVAQRPAPRSNDRRRLLVRSICREPLLVDVEIKTKALVSPGRDLITFLLV